MQVHYWPRSDTLHGGMRMEPVKIMPCLDMKDGRVVKGVNFVNLRDAGDPVRNAEFYQAEGADELAMLDIAATLENRKTRLEWVKAVSAVIAPTTRFSTTDWWR